MKQAGFNGHLFLQRGLDRDDLALHDGAFGEIADDIDGQGCVKFPHHRQREIPVVAIPIVEGEAGKTPREVVFDHSPMQFVDGDDIDAA